MDVSATFKGNSVRILEVTRNGSSTYVTYLDTDSNMFSDTLYTPGSSATSVALSGTVN